MRIAVIDPILQHGLPLVQRLVHDGHEVVYAPIWGPKGDSPFVRVLGRGLGATVIRENWLRAAKGADVAVITGVEHRGTYAASLRAQGVPVAAPSAQGTELELSRWTGREAFKAMGLKPTPCKRFKRLAEVGAYVKANPRRYVLKLDQGARAASETVVGRHPKGEDIREAADRLSTAIGYLDGLITVYLETFTPGTEVGIGGWFNGERLMGRLMRTYEGDGGYAYDLRQELPPWVSVPRLESVLRDVGYRGTFDINGILDESGDYRPIEWTARWGSGTTEFFCHAPDDLGELLLAAATGKAYDPIGDAVEGKLGVLINLRDEGDMQAPSEIVPKDDSQPYVFHEEASFWPIWPGAPRELPWLSFPVHPQSERRVASYVGIGSDLRSALKQIRTLADEVSISGMAFEFGRARDDLESKIPGESREHREREAIRKHAQETRSFWWDRTSG